MGPEDPHPTSSSHRGPQMAAGAIGVAPVMGSLLGEGHDSWIAHTDAAQPTSNYVGNQMIARVPMSNGDSNQMTAAPDLLDDEVVVTSQALVPFGSEPDDVEGVETSLQLAAMSEQAVEAPTIAGLGKIKRTSGGKPAPKKRERIVVPERSINGGLDFKFDTDPNNMDLCDLMTKEEYTDAITTLNDKLRPSRSKKVDAACLITGPLLVPLAFWGIRHSKQVKNRKILLVYGIQDFNDSHPTLYMRYNRPGSSSFLTIERRTLDHNAMATGVEESWMDHEPVV